MLDINFLRDPISISMGLSGMEFLQFQNQKAYDRLVTVFNEIISPEGHITLSVDVCERLQDIVMQETGIKVNIVELKEVGKLGIESGGMAPSAILNNKQVDEWLTADYSTVGRAMKTLQTDILKGTVDVKTGKISGGFSKIEFPMFINPEFLTQHGKEYMVKYKLTYAEAMAVYVLHEVGHVFCGLLMMFRTTIDTLFPLTVARMYGNSPAVSEKKIILKEALAVLEADGKVDDAVVAGLADGAEAHLFLQKAIYNRNTRRTLSIGVRNRASEIYADMYAMRMGCPAKAAAAIGMVDNLKASGALWAVAIGMMVAVVPLGLVGTIGAGIGAGMSGFGTVITGMLVNAEFIQPLVPGDTYDTQYRRVKNLVREAISILTTDKKMDSRERLALLNKCKEMDKIAEDLKPMMEGTAAQRLSMWLFSGADFKAQEFEHYTQEVMAHNLNLYTELFSKGK